MLPRTSARLFITPQIMGNHSLARTTPPGASHTFAPRELVLGVRLWHSTQLADALSLTPPLAGFHMRTSTRHDFIAGGPRPKGFVDDSLVLTSRADIGSGVLVGAAAYSSDAVVHSFALVFLGRPTASTGTTDFDL